MTALAAGCLLPITFIIFSTNKWKKCDAMVILLGSAVSLNCSVHVSLGL
jgi:hypothetical protein